MTGARLALAGLGVCVWLTATAAGRDQVRQPLLHDLLVGQLKFSAAQLAAVRRGDPVTAGLPAPLPSQIGVAGAVRINTPPTRLVAMVRDIESLERGKGFIATRKISQPPTVADFAAFDLPAEDVEALRRCRPADCDVKLGLGGFDVLRQVDWDAPDVVARVRQFSRRLAVEYLARYMAGGNAALAIYRDDDRPMSVADEFGDMVKTSAVLTSAFPAVARDLLAYPDGRPSSAEDFFYWSLADFGLKPVFRLNHVSIHRARSSDEPAAVITTKQLYASHYFRTALEVRVLVDDEENPGRGHYLVVLNLARSDGMTGFFGALVRSKARGGATRALQTALTTMKRRAESS